jgi:hypothetical protein
MPKLFLGHFAGPPLRTISLSAQDRPALESDSRLFAVVSMTSGSARRARVGRSAPVPRGGGGNRRPTGAETTRRLARRQRAAVLVRRACPGGSFDAIPDPPWSLRFGSGRDGQAEAGRDRRPSAAHVCTGCSTNQQATVVATEPEAHSTYNWTPYNHSARIGTWHPNPAAPPRRRRPAESPR